MADTKITALTALTAADPANDVLPIVDVSDTTMAASGTTKKISVNNILGASGTATLASATITGAANLNGAVNLNTAGSSTVTLGASSSYGVLSGSGTNAASIYINGATRPGFNSVLQFGAAEHQWYNSSLSSLIATLNSTGLGVGNAPVAALDVYKVANDTINRTNATFCFGQIAGLGAALLGQQSASAPYQFNLQAANAANSVQFPLVLQPSGGNVGIGVTPSAGKGCLQLSSGINFPATQVASSDANTLDDYEEGSFTPTPNSGTFSAASAKYTKIGNMVTVFFDLTVGTGGGSQITNLPFTAASTSTVASGIYTNNQTYAAGTTAPVVVVGGSGTVMYFRTVGTGVAFSAMSFTAGANLTGTISYFV